MAIWTSVAPLAFTVGIPSIDHSVVETTNRVIPDTVCVYLYAKANPITYIDPSGHLFLANLIYGQIVHDKIGEDFEDRGFGVSDARIDVILGAPNAFGAYRPDLTTAATKETPGEVYEIKSVITGSGAAVSQLGFYLVVLNATDPQKRSWIPGTSYYPPSIIVVKPGTVALVRRTAPGVILYEIVDATEILGAAAAFTIASLEIDLTFALTLALRGII